MLLTNDTLSQQAPDTDGRWVVWQQLQPNFSSDIFVYDALNPGNAPIAVTDDPDQVQTNAIVAWPWVVYQQRPLNDATHRSNSTPIISTVAAGLRSTAAHRTRSTPACTLDAWVARPTRCGQR